jgi:AcrR family transcriptional regulator
VSGLRQTKQLKTKQAIQQAAIRLFGTQGYSSTTVEQIAERAEVSPSTFFRYFGSKQDVVMYDSLDPLIMEAFRAQPRGLKIIPALRRAIKDVYAQLSPHQYELEMQRFTLVRTIPELQAKILDEMARSIDLFADLIAERTGKDAEDLAVRNLAGSIIGSGMAALLRAYRRKPGRDSIDTFDAALARLEQGLDL